MAAQVAILSRKVLLDEGDVEWISAPMYWGGYQKAEMFLEAHGVGDAVDTGCYLVFEGATEPGENANWQTIAAGTPADPSALTAKGVNKYVREGLYPYVRIKVKIDATAGLRIAELSVNGQLHDEV